MSVSRRWLIALFTVAFLVARLTGAHLHLCLDGSEPLAQLHVSDATETDHYHLADRHDATGQHPAGTDAAAAHSVAGDDAAQPAGHDDVDVDALGTVLAKAFKVDLPAIALLAICFALIWVALVRLPLPDFIRPAERPPVRYLRPLLRGPPA